MAIDSPIADRSQPTSASQSSSSPLTLAAAAMSSPSTVRAATSLGTGSLAVNGINMTNNNTMMVSKIVMDTPPILDETTIDALLIPNNKKKKYRMVALDLDGTLLNSSHQISLETKQYIRYLILDGGFTVVFATGRAISTVYEHILALNLPPNITIPVVSSNGACAFDCRVVVAEETASSQQQQPGTTFMVDAKPLFVTPVPEPVARKTIQLARQYGHCSQYYVGDEILADPIITPQEQQLQQEKDTNTSTGTTTTTTTTRSCGYRSHLQLTKLYIDLTGAQTKYLPHDENFEHACIRKGLPSKQLVLFPPLLQDEMMAVFEREMNQVDLIAAVAAASTTSLDHPAGTDVAVTSSLALTSAATIVRGNLGWFLEILHPTVCKGVGLQRLVTEHLANMNLDDCIAFGDGDNDVEFLQMAGLGIVMLNGRKVAKQAADCMTSHGHDENGVVKTLQLLEERGKLHFPKTPSQSSLPLKSCPLPVSTKATKSVSTASLSSSSTATSSSSDSVVAAGLPVDDNSNHTDMYNDNTDTVEEDISSCNRQERCDTVEF